MHDVLIAGGGPVGAVLALCLRDSGLDVQVVDSARYQDEVLRPVALSHASRLLLERCDAFDHATGTPIHSVHVSQNARFGRTLIRDSELGVPALGYVFNLSTLARSLSQRPDTNRIEGRLRDWSATHDSLAIRIDSDSQTHTTHTRLLVVADGGQTTGDDLALRDYGQSAIVATVRTTENPEGRAWERFCANGPLALLPYADRYALVWTTTSSHARHLLGLSNDVFLHDLQQTFGRRLGRFIETSQRLSFPLQLRYKNDPVLGARALIVGNAAQSLHPVAGQGLNLGLRDAFELAEILRASSRNEIGNGEFLERYRLRRHNDRRATIGATDSLIHLFSADDSAMARARGAALLALDLLPPLRRAFARRMVYGMRNLP